MSTTTTATLEASARRRAQYLTGLLWHVGSFVIINGFFWLLDGMVGSEGIQWAYWITLFWGFALAFHVVAWLVDGRELEERKVREYLGEEPSRAGARSPAPDDLGE